MALCLPTLKLFKQKHNPFKTLQPCARSSSSCTSSSFLTSLFSLRLKPLFVFICLYLFLFVFICLYLSLFVFICLYFSLFVFYLSLFVFICLYLSLFVFICLYLSLFVFICLYLFLFVFICFYLSLFVFICLYLSLICLYLSLFVKICRSCRTSPVDLIPVVLVRCKRSMKNRVYLSAGNPLVAATNVLMPPGHQDDYSYSVSLCLAAAIFAR